ncbi:S28 family serine protease [Streptomyces sp. NPDC055749]
MRKALRCLLPLAVLIGTATTSGTTAGTAAAAPATDIKDRILAVPGMSLIEEKSHPGYRFFVLNYTQPVDHRNPGKGTFEQRLTLLHKDTTRPTVFFTSGYDLYAEPNRSEPTTIVDGNQVSLEYRYFTPSRPQPADWSKLDIRQAAADQHRVFTVLKKIYDRKWIATGGSKGGMTATYYERFHPNDMDGVVAYVAPNNVHDDEDSAYDRFFGHVGSRACREKLRAVQREALIRRASMLPILKKHAAAKGLTFKTVGGPDKAYEGTVTDFEWAFWQYSLLTDCARIPAAARATDRKLFDTIDKVVPFAGYDDRDLAGYTPYFYQAGTELGSPDVVQPHLDGLRRYGAIPPRNLVPRDIPMHFKPAVMKDIDAWVRHNARRMMFVNGRNDPWSAEPFRLGKGARDSYVHTAPGANHGAEVALLPAGQRAAATASILKWAGVATAAVRRDPAKARPLAEADARLDRRDAGRQQTLLP